MTQTEHIYRPGKDNSPTLILLHGTGGDETDLIPLGTALNPNYNLLSIRGEVNENGICLLYTSPSPRDS